MEQKMGRGILVLFIIFTGIAFSQTFYRTGFEAEGEPFGNFKEGNITGQGEWKGQGKITRETSYAGIQCATPGPGDGHYGQSLRITLEPKEVPELWVDYFLYPARAETGYGAFLWLKGISKSNETVLSTYLIFSQGGWIYAMQPSGNNISISQWFPEKWQRITIKLDFNKKVYDVFVDEKLKKTGVPFYGHKSEESWKPENLTEVILGGGSAKDSLAYYDDIYIGTVSPLNR